MTLLCTGMNIGKFEVWHMETILVTSQRPSIVKNRVERAVIVTSVSSAPQEMCNPSVVYEP